MFVIIFAVVVSERYSIAAIVFASRLSFFAVGTFHAERSKRKFFMSFLVVGITLVINEFFNFNISHFIVQISGLLTYEQNYIGLQEFWNFRTS